MKNIKTRKTVHTNIYFPYMSCSIQLRKFNINFREQQLIY